MMYRSTRNLSVNVAGAHSPAFWKNFRVPVWLGALFCAPLLALLLAPSGVHAGTITITHGPDTPPVGGVYTDGYIQAQLIAGDLAITTTGVITGPDEIRVRQNAVITWTSAHALTLDAGASIVISGTIQHDGPATGAGGLTLLAPAGTVQIGPGDQNKGVAAGSRFGLTRVQAANLAVQGGDGGLQPYALLGFHAEGQDATYTVTGVISVTVGQNLTVTGGSNPNAYAQIGHGGYQATGSFGGSHRLEVGGNARVAGGSAVGAYAQVGNGGGAADGDHSGGHRLVAGDDVTFQAGDVASAYAQFGNGGNLADGDQRGGQQLVAGGDVIFQAGDGFAAYVQLGNGGYQAFGDQRGGHRLTAGGAVAFLAGPALYAYAQLGNGGFEADGDHGGGHRLVAGGDVTFQSSSAFAYSQFGNGGQDADGNQSGAHVLDAGGAVTFQAGNANAYSQFGNGGTDATGDQSGNHSLSAGADVHFQGGRGQFAYVQYGNGGFTAEGNHSGTLLLDAGRNLTMIAGSGEDAYAMLGHGADARLNPGQQSGGSRAGDLMVRIGESGVFSGSQVGSLTNSGVLSVTQGNTFLGVSQNHPAYAGGAGELAVSGAAHFASAPAVNGGELRIYLPREESQQIPTTATFNGNGFDTANVIPAGRIRGYFPFGEGPYLLPFSFYLGPRPDVALTKSAAPAGLLRPGEALTYTLSFSNTGNYTATSVVLTDTLPAAVALVSITPLPDAGVSITQTGGAPNLAWSMSNLGPGQGGRIHLNATVQSAAEFMGTLFTNSATITATGDLDANNNAASVPRGIVAAATLTITKRVVGDPPADAWHFSGSGGIVSFTLPAAGGSQVITGLVSGAYTITETTKPGYDVTVACTNGQNGATSSISINLLPGQRAACTFTNTKETPVEAGAVAGLVYADANGNEQPDLSEGVAGVTVTLESDTGVAAALTLTDTTDANGEYSFADVPVGDYIVSFALPTGYDSLADVQVTVIAGQTTQVPTQRARPASAGTIYLPVLRR